MDHLFEDHFFEDHVSITCSCDVEYCILTPTSAQESNPSLPNKLEIQLLCLHDQIEDGTAVTVSSQFNAGMDVIKNFKSYNLVRGTIDNMLLDFKAPSCCCDFLTDCVLDSASYIPEIVGGSFLLTASVKITMVENLDDPIHAGITESMEEDCVRRIPASKSFIDGLKKQEYRHNNRDSNATTSCAVCLEQILDGSVISNMPCLHMFHSACLVTWLHERNSCPLCRRQVDPAE
ncbi:NEP1-interacting protein 2-like [Papaver somniferum]|uniref:NEP1-interacting protein 2-like n=1 Tax=Papaver somniferum TaxID=3469 RepID=UPI000E6FD31B|nr:NEP1-interacting protein 2-like [Papaver somniferum]